MVNNAKPVDGVALSTKYGLDIPLSNSLVFGLKNDVAEIVDITFNTPAAQSGVASRSETTATIVSANHGLVENDTINVVTSSHTSTIKVATDVAVTVVDANTFTITCLDDGATSGIAITYTQNFVATAAKYNVLPIGSKVFDTIGSKIYLKTGASTWKSATVS